MFENILPDSNLHIYYFESLITYEIEKNFDFDNRIYIGNWVEDESSFLFFTQNVDNKINKLIEKYNLKLLDKFEMTYESWCGDSISYIKAGSFVIVPPWVQKNIKKNEIRINLHPGVVFGAGNHQTTFDCLQAIEMVYKLEQIQSMIDIGTGTGVLAIAGAKLGISKIIGVDLNPLATRTAKNNISSNNLEKQILIIRALGQSYINTKTDLLVSNIHYDILKVIINSKGFLEKKYFILSGLLPSQGKKILNTLENMPLSIIKIWDNHWLTCLGKTDL